MGPIRRTSWAAALALGMVAAVAALASPALAQPINDDIANAIVITEPLPFSDSTSTVDATTAPDDPDCVGNGPTVWYTFTPSADMRVRAHTVGSDYDTTLSVYAGAPGTLEQIACNDDSVGLQSSVVWEAAAGTTNYLMVGSFASGPGGNLVFTVELPPPPLELAVSANGTGSIGRETNTVTVGGTVTCNTPAGVSIYGQVSQQVGREVAQGWFDTFFDCDGETSWTAEAFGGSVAFMPGWAALSVHASGCDGVTCDGAEIQRIIKLRRAR